MKKALVFLMILIVFTSAVFAEAVAEKAAKWDEVAEQIEAQRAYQEALSKSAAANINKKINVKLGTLEGVTRPPVVGSSIAASGHPRSTMAGYNILQKGGTAFDAAVAIAAVEGIMKPAATNILGGDAEIMVWSAKDQKLTVFNGTGWASENATLDFYLNLGGIPATGLYSIELPGAWAGWMTMLEQYGTLPLTEILDPAIEAAGKIVVDDALIDPAQTGNWTTCAKNEEYDESVRKLYSKNGEIGNYYEVGDVWSNPDLVRTFQELAAASEEGKTLSEGYRLAKDYFYRGPIAERIVAWSDAKEEGGFLTLADFNDFDAEIQEPWSTTYKGYEVFVCPPNSQGPTLLEALNILENFDLSVYEHNSAEYIDLLTQVLNLALVDRNNNITDMRFVEYDKDIISKEYASKRAEEIKLGTPMASIPEGQTWRSYAERGNDTTFMYVADKYGNIVVSTHSLCTLYGSSCVVDGTGIVMNNRMTYFEIDADEANCVEPRKRTLQTITPSIILKDGKPAMWVGTPGSDVQEQSKLQVLLNYLEFGYTNPQKAIEQGRFLTAAPDGFLMSTAVPKFLWVEHWAMSEEEIMKLEKLGYRVMLISPNAHGSIGFGVVLPDGSYYGGYDPRFHGLAVAW